MKKLRCEFSGWFDVDVEDVRLIGKGEDDDDVIKTAAQWLEEQGNIHGLVLESFRDAEARSLDGEFEQLDLSVVPDV